MNIISYLFQTIKQNKIFLIIIFVFVLIASYIHFKNQKISFTSSFITSNGMYLSDYLTELIVFNSIDSNSYNLNSKTLESYNKTLSKLSISSIVGSQKYIKINLISNSNFTAKKNDLQLIILDLMNHNKYISSINEIILEKQFKKKKLILDQINIYRSLLDTISIINNTSKYLKIEKRISKLKSKLIALDEDINTIGKFYVITPIKNFSSKSKPFPMFIFLYLFLGGIIFILFSKKTITSNLHNI